MKILNWRSSFLLPILLISSKRTFIQRRITSMKNDNIQLALDAFAVRQFNNPTYTGTQVSFSEVEFEKLVNDAYANGAKLVDGYAPFWSVILICCGNRD